jgi:hypothetical protein
MPEERGVGRDGELPFLGLEECVDVSHLALVDDDAAFHIGDQIRRERPVRGGFRKRRVGVGGGAEIGEQ